MSRPDMDPKTKLAEVLATLLAEPTHVDDLEPDDPLRLTGVQIGDLITATVDFLRTDMFPNPKVNNLMALVWDLIGQQITPCVLGPNVPTPTFTIIGTPDGAKALILMPPNWPSMMAEDPQMQVGALVFVGSQARDYYTGRLQTPEDSETVSRRARGYEAEYLLALKALGYTGFNEYQQDILSNFPNGVPDNLAYDSKPTAQA